jgi:hypothetical protein
MPPLVLTPNPALVEASRFRALVRGGERATWVEFAFLIGCGVCAALASTVLRMQLRIPGHAVLRAIVPISLGLAVVPRRGAGSGNRSRAEGDSSIVRGRGDEDSPARSMI